MLTLEIKTRIGTNLADKVGSDHLLRLFCQHAKQGNQTINQQNENFESEIYKL